MAKVGIFNGFQFSDLGIPSGTLSSGGSSDIVYLTSSFWFFPHVKGPVQGLEYSSSIQYAVTAINALTNPADDFSITYDLQTNKFRLFRTGGGTFNFRGNDGMQKLYGFFSGQHTTVTQVTSSHLPCNCYVSVENGWSEASNEYERESRTEERVADDGSTYAISRTSGSLFFDFMLVLEPEERVFDYRANYERGTWQRNLRMATKVRGLVLFHHTASTVAWADRRLAGKFASDVFEPKQFQDGWDAYWNIPVNIRILNKP